MPGATTNQLGARLLALTGRPGDVRRKLVAALPDPARERLHVRVFEARWGFPPPPAGSDLSHYERFLAMAEEKGLARVPGDIVEIGVFLGGGTYKLSQYFARRAPDKRVIAVDVFDPAFDATECTEGQAMATLYEGWLAGRDQRAVFDEVTASCTNLVVLAADSAKVELPCERIAFAYVDGNHSAPYVRSDFELVWSKLSPGGVVGFDDYGGNIPEVTRTLHELIGERASEIARIWVDGPTLLIERG